ncbi:MAG TPA: protein kinase [Gemmatimonadales bacterium]|jgi:serine/threonine-protein kinase|nr:protein kinase [Gemmatimonadales bacterium]
MIDLLDSIRASFAGRYQIERELGRGGMSTVYLALDPKHGRQVALKVFEPDLGPSVGSDRFLREIRVAARLTHPHILPLHDSGEVDGLLYYVMPYIEGESLRAWLQREHRLALHEALDLGRQVADALDYAHQHGVVHRDIKPENILIANGEAVLADFGIARALGAGTELLTGGGMAVGTPMYMSPEQAAGEPDIDGRSDIYSLGCVLFEALAGVPPFSGSSVQAILVQRLLETPARLRSIQPEVPEAVEAAIARALARKPADRFATAAGFSSALADVAGGRSGGGITLVPGPQTTAEASVAVLPFLSLSSDPENEYFSDGMTDEIINALAQIPGLRVTARTSSFMFKGKSVDAREIGERLKVRTLLEGSLRKAGNRIRMSVQLINASSGYHLWSHTYERTLDDVFVMQDELTRAIVTELTARVVGTPSDLLVRPATAVPEAYALYLQGCYFLNKRTAEGFVAAIEHFQQAIERDPEYAAAYANLAYCLAMAGFDTFGVMSPLEAMPQAQAAVSKALELDPALAEAHGAQAIVAALFHWDWAQAEREFDLALSLGGKSPPTHVWHALFLCAMGRPEEGLQIVTTALAFDPLSLGLHLTVGRCLVWAGRYREALAKLLATLEMEPTHPPTYWELGRVYQLLGMHTQSAAILEQGIQLIGRAPILLMYLGSAYAKLGQRERALDIVRELRELAGQHYLSPLYESHVLASLGDLDGAFDLIERAYALRSGWLSFFRVDPAWDPLRHDLRYLALLEKLG